MEPESSDHTSHLHAEGTSPSYIPADKDTEFLQREELRPIRIGLELLKPELIQREQGIQSTIVVFGSSRLQESAAAKYALRMAEEEAARAPNDPTCQQKVAIARRYVNDARTRNLGVFGQLYAQIDLAGQPTCKSLHKTGAHMLDEKDGSGKITWKGRQDRGESRRPACRRGDADNTHREWPDNG